MSTTDSIREACETLNASETVSPFMRGQSVEIHVVGDQWIHGYYLGSPREGQHNVLLPDSEMTVIAHNVREAVR